MGMGFEHELTVRYAAGSLGGTLGRLHDSVGRLSRALRWRVRGTTREARAARFPEPAGLANLNQLLRLMADAWQSRQTARPRFSRLDAQLDRLKGAALDRLSGRPGRPVEYYRLALVMDRLRAFEFGQRL